MVVVVSVCRLGEENVCRCPGRWTRVICFLCNNLSNGFCFLNPVRLSIINLNASDLL